MSKLGQHIIELEERDALEFNEATGQYEFKDTQANNETAGDIVEFFEQRGYTLQVGENETAGVARFLKGNTLVTVRVEAND